MQPKYINGGPFQYWCFFTRVFLTVQRTRVLLISPQVSRETSCKNVAIRIIKEIMSQYILLLSHKVYFKRAENCLKTQCFVFNEIWRFRFLSVSATDPLTFLASRNLLAAAIKGLGSGPPHQSNIGTCLSVCHIVLKQNHSEV